MNATELLAVLNVPKNKETLNHATRLLAIYSLLRSVKNDITGAKITGKAGLMFGKKTEFWRGEIRVINPGWELPAENINVKIENGEYNFLIPVKNDFHSMVCNMLQIETEKTETPAAEVVESFEIEKTVIEKIKIAAKYAAKKNQLPGQSMFEGVLISIKNEWAEVVGSDRMRIFVSDKLVTDSKDRNLLIAPASFKAAAGVVASGDFCRVDILKTGDVKIEGVKIELMHDVYVDYRSVIPQYQTKMVFNRKEFISTVRGVMSSANKNTNLIKLHLNGTIEITAQDIDRETASVSSMQYDLKEFEDLDIGFNGLLIQEVLTGFKSEKISMMTVGGSGRAVLFTDGIDKGVLMPMSI